MANYIDVVAETCERLRDMSQTTCIMTNPELLQKEALENICYIDTCGDKSRDYLVSVPVSDLRNVRAIESSVYTASPHRQSNILDRNGVIFKSMLDQKMDVDDHDGGNSLSVFSTCSMLDKFPSHIPSISVFNPAVRPTMQSVDFSSNITSTEILPLSNSSSVIYMPSTLSMNRCSQSYSSMLSSEGGPSLTCSIFSESPAINYECSDSKITTCPDSNGKITLTTVADHVVSSMSSVDVIGLSDAHHVYDFDLIDIPLPELDKEETVYWCQRCYLCLVRFLCFSHVFYSVCHSLWYSKFLGYIHEHIYIYVFVLWDTYNGVHSMFLGYIHGHIDIYVFFGMHTMGYIQYFWDTFMDI